MISTLSDVTKRHSLLVFFVLAYALSWWAWLLYPVGLWPIPIFPAGPFLAAVVVLALTTGKPGLKDLLQRMVKWRVGLRWYVVALGLPTILTLIAVVLNISLGAPAPTAEQFSGWPDLLPTLIVVLLVPGLGGPWEEPGWRGYALERLQIRRSPLTASLILALFGVVWHLPLFMIGDIQWPDIFFIVVGYIVLTWIYNGCGRSILILMLTHATLNTVSGNFFSQMFSGADAVRQSWLSALVWGVVALMIIATGRLQRPRSANNTFEQPLAELALPLANQDLPA